MWRLQGGDASVMVKAPSLGLLVATMCCIASCASAPAPIDYHHHHQQQQQQHQELLIDDGAEFARAERSASSMARKIQFFIKNYHLQILPDGTVNGTLDDGSVYTILQRTAIGIGKLKIQGVGTCQYLCMDACGFLYGSREFNEECVFNEMIQEHHYNTYSSTRYSNEKRTMYLALNRKGTPRKVLLHAGHPLGRLSSYTRVLTRTVPPQKLEDLHPVRHHGHSCPADPVKPHSQQQPPARCRRHKKRKKRKRKCPEDEDSPGESPCIGGGGKRQRGRPVANSHSNINSSHRCESDDSEECQRVVVDLNVGGGGGKKASSSSAKTKLGDRLASSGAKKKRLQMKGITKVAGGGGGGGARKRLRNTTHGPPTTTPLPTLVEEGTEEGDYLDGTTALEWDDPTAAPTPEEAAALPD